MRGSKAHERSIAARYVGRLLIVVSAALFLGGAVRMQSNMISSGLLCLSLGLIFAPDLWQRGWPLRLGILALVCVGVGLAVVT